MYSKSEALRLCGTKKLHRSSNDSFTMSTMSEELCMCRAEEKIYETISSPSNQTNR